MSTSSQDDWRAQALRNMELANPPAPQREPRAGWLGLVVLKIGFLILLSVGLVYFGGWGFIAAPAFAAWYLFWPR